jgi:hypothetical protein
MSSSDTLIPGVPGDQAADEARPILEFPPLLEDVWRSMPFNATPRDRGAMTLQD